ncbi:ligand-binding sensor domain-containing diguanylate cyclase [Pseudoduganella lutea]|uniref:ligand-binding sensor domain-containing diguanylate cyclase n=1 Tax=Pseudoduganella lutea TaxID=321985 RepID=UPI0013EE4512|nr:ligand-binding sensor domain-containing diguanylate cyclase [Pseudoduganella lutea]
MRRYFSCLTLLALLALPWLPRTVYAAAPAPWSTLAHTSFIHHKAPSLGVGTALAQDRQGFIWLGTQTGLMRWDGFQFRRYQAAPGKSGSLPDSYILSLHVDSTGRLWIGTNSGGIARYDAAQDNFITVGVGKGGLSHVQVTSIAEDGKGGMWVGTGAGLERIDAAGVVHDAHSGAPQLDTMALSKGGIESLLRDRSGALWIGTKKGLWRRNADDQPAVPVHLQVEGPSQPTVSRLYQDSVGRIWIGTRANGAFMHNDARQGPVGLRESPAPSTLQNERIFSIVEKTAGVMWLGTEGGGIVEVDVERGRTRRIRHLAEIADSLIDDDVSALLRDHSGQIFAATMDGLSQHDPRTNGLITIRSLGSPAKLDVPSVLARPDGSVWFGVMTGKIEIVDPNLGVIGELAPATGTRTRGLPKSRILAMANGPGDTVFIATQHGVFHGTADGRDIRRIEIAGRPGESPAWSLAWHDGVLWLGGLDGVWGVKITPDGSTQVIRHEERALGDSRVTAILALADGSIWTGTMAGLARLDTRTNVVERVPLDRADQPNAPGHYVSSIIQDAKGRIWVSTFSSGIAVLERTDAQGRRWFRRFGTADGLPDNGVNALVQDAAGRIWISTDNGLAGIDAETFAIRKLGIADGLQVSAYWTGAGTRTPAGDVVFGGVSGVSVLRPAHLKRPGYRAAMAITQVSLGGRTVTSVPSNGGAGMPLQIAPHERERGIALEFSALDFAPPGYRHYAYRLDGFDRDWIETDAVPPRASYTNLPPGKYTLELRGTAEGGGEALLRVPVVALPAWYQQDWVRVLGGLGVLLLLVLLTQARTSLLRRKKRELEAIIAGRTAELRATQARLEEMAYGDTLTGLPNRRLFNDTLRRMTAQAARGGQPFALLLVDLDHFKSVNDTLGHDAGDALLVTAAERLRSVVREGDLVARLGGDEFAILLAPGYEPGVVRDICERIVAAMATPVIHGTHTIQISASVGVAGYAKEQNSAEQLYKCADIALYQSKEAGRNTWSSYATQESTR